jgi:membrane peptidoglycan carboxypeptidase
VSNPDWHGPYWQDDASAGRRGGHDDLSQQSPWEDAGFWRADERRTGRADDWQPARGGDRGSRRARGSGARGSGWEDGGNGNGRADGGSRRASRGQDGANGAAGGGGRFGQTADDLKNRLGLRGSVLNRDRGRGGDQATDADFWGESGGAGGRTQGWRQNGAGGSTANGNGANGNGANGHRNGSGGYRGTRRANGASAAYGEDGAGQEWSGRTALRDRIQDGVRSRTATLQRGGNRGGRAGGGGGWDGDGPSGEPRNWRQRFKRYIRSGDWWRHWTWKKFLGLAGGGIAAVVLLGALAIFIIYEHTPIPTASELTANWQSSQVYFSNGKLIGTFDDTVNGVNVNRTLLTESQIPKVMTEAMTAAEDRGFYTEGGISVTGLLRSAYDDVFGSGGLQGGSTITMQYAKNYYTGVNTGQNASTKIKEIFIAMKLAHNKSKQWIMTQYLNTVPFGPTTYGVAAGAEEYFDINLTQSGTLTISQAAMLAAMPNQPGYFNPDPSSGAPYDALYKRWKYVLNNMVRDGNITAAQAAGAKFPVLHPPPMGNGASGYTGYLMDMVRQELEASYGYTSQQLDTKGLKITTTFSQSKIKALIKSVKAEKAQMRAAGTALPYYDHIGAVLEDAKTGAIIAVYGGPGEYLKHCGGQVDCDQNNAEIPQPVGSSFKPIVLSTAVYEGMNVFTSKLNGDIPIWVPVPQANPISKPAQLMLSPTSPPRGSSGGCNPGCFSKAPDGSSVYLKHFDNGDASGGPITVANAAANSSDPAFEDLAHADGIQNVIDMAGALGVGSTPFQETCYQYSVPVSQFSRTAMLKKCNDLTGVFSLNSLFSPTHSGPAGTAAGTPGSPTIALGEGQLTAIEQASIFATLANGGLYHSPHVIASLAQNGVKVPLKIATRQVLSQQQAADVDYALSFDNTYGTAACSVPFRNNGGIIAKTGTLGSGANSSQAWFVGATPKGYAMSVALYTNAPNKEVLNNLPFRCLPGSQGGAWPATIWNNYFTSLWGGQQYQTVQQVFQPVNGYPFQTWIRLKPKAKKAKFCRPGQGHGQNQNCTCRPGLRFFGGCPGGNPTPSPTCSFPGQQNCTNPTPNPTQTCFPPGQCNNPSPTPSPSTSTCLPPGPCKTTTAADTTVKTAARPTAVTKPVTVAQDTYAFFAGTLAKLERLILIS